MHLIKKLFWQKLFSSMSYQSKCNIKSRLWSHLVTKCSFLHNLVYVLFDKSCLVPCPLKGCVIKSQYYIYSHFATKVNFVTRVKRMSWKSLFSLLINTVLTVMVFINVITAIASVLLCRLVFCEGQSFA